jgi:N-acyl-D-aspartate/D-glutamate deacylase
VIPAVSEAGGSGGLGAMTHREHLAQADRFIAECKNRIARQREIIATAYEDGHSTDIPVSMLRALEENLRSFERHRQVILDQLKNADRQRLARTASPSSVRN